MDKEIYVQLRKHLDNQPAGLPETQSGAEIDILKRFYTPEQAKIALKMTNIPEPAVKIAKRLKIDEDKARKSLEKMAKDGLLFRLRTSEAPLYMQPNFIMGIYEWHVNTIDREIARKVDDVYDRLLEKHWNNKKVKPMRVVPVQQSIETKDKVHPYIRIKEVISGEENKPYAIAPCICRVEQEKKGTPTGRLIETCLTFGMAAKYNIENSIGREISEQELFDKLDECEKEGLVPLSTNSKKIIYLCMCDKQGCQILKNIKKFEQPALQFNSGYIAKMEPSSCVGCGVCETRCQMEAITISGHKKNKKETPIYTINENFCIGCGLCVTTCPSDSIQLIEMNELLDIPETYLAMNIAIARERRQLNGLLPYGVVKWLLRFKLGKEAANEFL